MGTPGDRKKIEEVVRNPLEEPPSSDEVIPTFSEENLILQLPEPISEPTTMTILSQYQHIPPLSEFALPQLVEEPLVKQELPEEKPLTLEQAHIEDYFSQTKFYPTIAEDLTTYLQSTPKLDETTSIITLGEPGPSGLQSHLTKTELTRAPTKKIKKPQSLSKKSCVCEICDKVFPNAAKLSKHQLIHSASSPFKCEQCKKTFSTKFKLVRHVLIHSDRKQFSCTICDRTFHRKDHLKNHVKVHSPCKTYYVCKKPDCKKEYTSHMSYKKHIALHAAEEGSLVCQICSKTFESKDEILYHLKIHAGSRSVKNPNEKKFTCDLCDRKFFTRKDVRRHMVVHTGMRDFLCQFCPQRFGRKDHLVRHIKKSHSKMQTKPETIVKIEESETSLPKPISSDSESFGASSYLDTLFPQTFPELPILPSEPSEFLPHTSTTELKDLGSEVLKDIGEPSTSAYVPSETIPSPTDVPQDLLRENIVINDPELINLLESGEIETSENFPLPGFVQTFQNPPTTQS